MNNYNYILHAKDRWLDLKDSCYHVELDAHDCYPVNLDEIKADICAKREETNNER